MLTAHDDGWHVQLFRIHQRQTRAHVDIGAGGHGIIKRQNGIGKRRHGGLIGGVRMIAIEYALHEGVIDRTTIFCNEIRQFLLALGQGRAALAGPDKGIQRQTRHALRMPLGKHRCLQCTRGNAVDQKLLRTGGAGDVVGRSRQIVSAVLDIEIDIAVLVGQSIALVVHGPGVEATRSKPVHRRGIGTPRHLQIEGRTRSHGRAMHEQHRAALGRNIRTGIRPGVGPGLLPQKQLDIAIRGRTGDPVLDTGFRGQALALARYVAHARSRIFS